MLKKWEESVIPTVSGMNEKKFGDRADGTRTSKISSLFPFSFVISNRCVSICIPFRFVFRVTRLNSLICPGWKRASSTLSLTSVMSRGWSRWSWREIQDPWQHLDVAERDREASWEIQHPVELGFWYDEHPEFCSSACSDWGPLVFFTGHSDTGHLSMVV